VGLSTVQVQTDEVSPIFHERRILQKGEFTMIAMPLLVVALLILK
jgi:uncharacterized membrane protein YfbV (UPF0208 family)